MTGQPSARPKLTQAPGFRMLYAIAGALAFGALIGLVRAPFWLVAVGGLAAAAAAFRLEWATLASADVRARPNFYMLLSAAFVFVALVAIGVVGLGYFLDEWVAFKLAHPH